MPEISRRRLEKLEKRAKGASKRARMAAGPTWQPALLTVIGNGVAGVIDSKAGEGAATLAGVGSGVAGIALGYPSLVSLGAGLVGPAAYRQGLKLGAKYLTKSTTTDSTVPA